MSEFNIFCANRLRDMGYSLAERRAFWRFISGRWDPPAPWPERWGKLRVQLGREFKHQQHQQQPKKKGQTQ